MTHLVTTPPPRGKKSNLGRNPVTFAVENSAQKPRGNGEIKQKARKRERETFALSRDVFSFIEISIRFSIHKKLYTKKTMVPQSAAISIKPSALPHNRLDQRTLPAALCANRRNARQTDVSLQPGEKFHGAW